MALSVDRSLAKARTLARRGDVVEAQALYDQILAQFPDNQRAKKGRTSLTDPSLTEDRSPDAQKALSGVLQLQRAGQLAEAEAAARHLVEKYPSAKAHFALGAVLLAREAAEEAAEAFARAIQLQPTFAKAYNNLGNALFRLGDHANAALAYNEALKHDDELAHAYSNLGAAFIEMDRYGAALRCLDVAVKLDPKIARAHNNRGLALGAFGRTEEALASFDTALALRPGSIEVFVNRANLLRLMNRQEEAIACLEKALGEDLDFAEGQNSLAALHRDLGNLDAARQHYRKALAARPTYAHAHYNLSGIKRYEPGDPHIAEMRALLNHDLNDDERLHLNFALGKAADDQGEIDEAFAHFAEGNRLRNGLHPYDAGAMRRRLEVIKTLSAGEVVPLTLQGADEHRPIFVVGMPRSGTTLVEQILSSHSAVHGGGEMTHMKRVAEQAMRGKNVLDKAVLGAIREGYLACLAQIGASEPVITDKMPANFQWVGVIAAAFPEAAIVDVRRDPRATCWSIFRHYFSDRGNDYAYDMADVADFYGLYLDMMAYWQDRLPGRVYTLNYERLTEDQEGETRRLLDHCDLSFEEACLAFHKSKRAVSTASAAQVRKGLYKGSSDSWRAYERHLVPMLEKLAEVGAI